MSSAGSHDPVHGLSFDIEDWFHVIGVPELEDSTTWADRESLVERRTDQILQICDDHGVKATFFVVGWIADRHPGLMRRIAEAGHEFGSHTHWHRLLFTLDRPTFREDLRRSIASIEDRTGLQVPGFRAPCFSLTPGCEWVGDELLDAGIRYDASLFPVPRENGGYPCPRAPHLFETPSGRRIPTLPMSVARIGPVVTGFSGGSYLRLLPIRLVESLFRRREKAGIPGVVYLHPRDFAPDCPRVPMGLRRRFNLHAGLASTERKLRRLLERFAFVPCSELVNRHFPVDEGNACSTS
ncbi:MAG: polysaccharide deacetylase family protein [Phycisphaerae bacterium]|nr:polysaccharide deacetylase family protein [Phycisphaerae bacterium]